MKNEDDASESGMHAERLRGRTQQMFFSPEAEENFLDPSAPVVDFEKAEEFDADEMSSTEVNLRIRALIANGVGTITIKNPGAKHSLCVGILNRLQLKFEGSLGYFGCGLLDGPNVHITGRVGWSFGENMMSGTAVIDKNAGSLFGAAIRGGDLVCRGDVGSRTGIDMKGGTLLVGGRTGGSSGFMMQRGRMIVLGDAGPHLGDSMYDGTIYVGGRIESLGVDAIEQEPTELEVQWLRRKLELYGFDPGQAGSLKKIAAGKKLWNYDNLEPTERKLIL